MINAQLGSTHFSGYKNEYSKSLVLKDGESATLDGAKKLEGQEHIDFLKNQIARLGELNFHSDQELRQELTEQGETPIDAMFVLDGKIIGGVTPGVLLPNSDMGLYKEGMTPEQLGAELKKKYGDRIEIQLYPEGQGPKYKEFVQAYSGKPYEIESFIQSNAETRKMFEDMAASMKASLQQAKLALQQENAPKISMSAG